MSPTVELGTSPARRKLLKHAAAAGLSLLIPGTRGPPASEVRPQRVSPGERALRIDLRHRVSDGVETFTLERLRLEATEAPLPDRLGWGDYRFALYDPDERTRIYSVGFDSTVDVYGRSATSALSIRCPLPARSAHAAIEKRRAESLFQECWRAAIDPDDEAIDRSARTLPVRVAPLLASGTPESKVDIAILGDGYRDIEHDKFMADAQRAADYLFSVDPFKRRTHDFNVHAVFAASAESGVTDSYLGLQKNTVFACAYLPGASERTLAAFNNHALREAASAVPYDFVMILANARRYGGSASLGGPAVVAIDSGAARYLVIHEFAHVIGGLADEYYLPAADGPAYAGNVEPWNPNVTIDPRRHKWHVPFHRRASEATPWNKREYEAYFARYAKRYYELRGSRADEAVIEHLMREFSTTASALLAKNAAPREVGWFEGANGYARGVFRAEVNCIMFSLQTQYFCSACSAAIDSMIDQHCT